MKTHPDSERREFARADYAGTKPPARPILISSLGIVPRRSSDGSSIYDPRLAAGMRFLCERAFESITVNDVVRAAGISRRVFERRFAKLNLAGRVAESQNAAVATGACERIADKDKLDSGADRRQDGL
jgi:hypothetical protein